MSDKPLPIPQPDALVDAKGQTTQTGYRYLESLGTSVRSLAGSKAAAVQTWEQSFLFEFPENGDYRVVINAQLARTITGVTTRSAAGTATLTVKINTTNLGGTANSVSTSAQTRTHSSANNVAVGNDIVFTFASATSTLAKVSVTLFGTLTLA
jgi:hypothetical protein